MKLILKPGREKSILRRHPWIFSGAVERVSGQPAPGQTVCVYAASGQALALAAYSPHSRIRARIWSWDTTEQIDADFLSQALRRAFDRRRAAVSADTDAYRLVHAESDGLPGLVVDRYADGLVVQFLSAGAEYWQRELIEALRDLSGSSWVYERSDAEVRRLEGLEKRSGARFGQVPEPYLELRENDLRFLVDIRRGHKTGFYLDQRENRARFAESAAGKSVLNAFAYTGAFAVYALSSGADRVLSVDTSEAALALGRENLGLNGLPADRAEWLNADVFAQLRRFRDENLRFDRIVLDPPKFAPTASQVKNAARAYKDINLLALKLLNPGGELFTFSCSGGISPELFQKIVAAAALDAGLNAQITRRLSQGPDHPVALNFPESEYLKGLVLRVD